MNSYTRNHVSTLQKWIESRLEKPITIAEICYKSGYCEGYLQKLFRKETGFSINEYVTRRRLYKCAMAIKFTSFPLLKIAERYGFYSMPAFSKIFRRILGVSPRQFRDSKFFDLGALANLKSIMDFDHQCLDVEYVYFDGLPLFGLSSECCIDPHDLDKPHLALKAPLDVEFAQQTQGRFNELYGQSHYRKSEQQVNKMIMSYSLGVREVFAQEFPSLYPLNPLIGDYLMFTNKGITTPFFDVGAIAYWETMLKWKITRRNGPDIEKIVWTDIVNSNKTTRTTIDYSFMIPVVFDQKVYDLISQWN